MFHRAGQENVRTAMNGIPLLKKLLHRLLKTAHKIKESANIVAFDAVSAEENARIKTSIEEFDRVLGGGIVAGSVILVGGDPVSENLR